MRHPLRHSQRTVIYAAHNVKCLAVTLIPPDDRQRVHAQRVKSIVDRYFIWTTLMGSMSPCCSNGSSSICASRRFTEPSENAVKTQIWIAVSTYVLVAIVRKRLGLQASLYQILQILSLTLFEKTPIYRHFR
jgi:hypothetical protein